MIRTLSVLAGLLTALAVVAPAQATTYTFAGFTFEQDDTPDVLGLVGGGATVSGAAFSSDFATNITRSVGFPQPPTAGFMPELSLGRQGNAQHGLLQTDNTSCTGACAVNLPDDNDGTSTRHGLAASWTGGRGLADASGVEFVIYESASNSSSDEAYMVTLQLSDGSFTNWRYEKPDAFELYVGDSSQGAFGTAFDLADFGVGSDDTVTAIYVANLTAADMVADSDGQGTVLFDSTGFAPQNLAGGPFAPGARDPDPLYIGILNGLTTTGSTDAPAPGALPLFAAGLGALMLGWRRRRA